MQNISKWQILMWDLQRDWESSLVRKTSRIFWAYTKLAWALFFCKDEFTILLNVDTEALVVMSPYQQERYDIILSKVRSKIGDHGFQLYTLKEFFQDVSQNKRCPPNTLE